MPKEQPHLARLQFALHSGDLCPPNLPGVPRLSNAVPWPVGSYIRRSVAEPLAGRTCGVVLLSCSTFPVNAPLCRAARLAHRGPHATTPPWSATNSASWCGKQSSEGRQAAYAARTQAPSSRSCARNPQVPTPSAHLRTPSRPQAQRREGASQALRSHCCSAAPAGCARLGPSRTVSPLK